MDSHDPFYRVRHLRPDHLTLEELPEDLTLEEFRYLAEKLLERVEELEREELRHERRQWAWLKGGAVLLIGQLDLKFGPLAVETWRRVLAADSDRLLEWGERILRAPTLADVFGD